MWVVHDFVLVDYMCVVDVVLCDICGCCVACDCGDKLMGRKYVVMCYV